MSASTLELDELSAVGTSVRRLALDARRVLRRGEPDGRGVEELLCRIAQMRSEHGDGPATPISRWLDNLRRQVEQR